MIDKKDIRLLYVGSLDKKSNSYRRFLTLTGICKHVASIDTDPYLLPKLISGIQHHLNIGPGIWLLNRKIKQALKKNTFDILFIDNKTYLTKDTLQQIRRQQPTLKIANLLTDDPFGIYTKSWRLIKATAGLFDIFFVQREANIEELKSCGATKVELCYRSFDPAFNRPVKLDGADQEKYHAPVGFVGTYESLRASYIAYLIQHGIPVTVIGNDFPNGDYWDIIQPHYRGPSIYGEEYIKTINGMDIALHFLRHGNRDEQDSRTFEIPACKVFMLAERSRIHLQLFKENEEAVFFDSKEELLEKVAHYLTDGAAREHIAANGYDRCFSSGYSHLERMKKVITTIIEDVKK